VLTRSRSRSTSPGNELAGADSETRAALVKAQGELVALLEKQMAKQDEGESSGSAASMLQALIDAKTDLIASLKAEAKRGSGPSNISRRKRPKTGQAIRAFADGELVDLTLLDD